MAYSRRSPASRRKIAGSAWPVYLIDRFAHNPRSNTSKRFADIARLDLQLTRQRKGRRPDTEPVWVKPYEGLVPLRDWVQAQADKELLSIGAIYMRLLRKSPLYSRVRILRISRSESYVETGL